MCAVIYLQGLILTDMPTKTRYTFLYHCPKTSYPLRSPSGTHLAQLEEHQQSRSLIPSYEAQPLYNLDQT
jgi:hypothetical protein